MNVYDYGFIPSLLPGGRREQDSSPARVVAVHKERYALVSEQGQTFGKLKSSVYHAGGQEAYPTVGDFVLIRFNPSGDSLIVQTLPRHSYFSRKDPGPNRGEQAVAANFDYVFIMQSLNMDFNLRRLERYITLARQSGATPVIVLNKADLAGDCRAQLQAVERIAAGIAVCPVSAKTGLGLDALSDFLSPGKTLVLLGSSGVGKSSLVNALAGEEVMSTREIREDDSKGRHTTTHRQLIMLPGGVMVIDTPGMRTLGMWDVRTGLGDAFADVEAYLGTCRFSDCRHGAEPGCAIKAAMERGELDPKRWRNYLTLKQEAMSAEDMEAMLKRKREWAKAISKQQRNLNRRGGRHSE